MEPNRGLRNQEVHRFFMQSYTESGRRLSLDAVLFHECLEV